MEQKLEEIQNALQDGYQFHKVIAEGDGMKWIFTKEGEVNRSVTIAKVDEADITLS